MELEDWDTAEKELKMAIEYDLPLAIDKKQKKYARDKNGYSLIVTKRQVAYRARMSLGSLYAMTKRLEDARDIYEEAVDIEPDEPEAYFELGKIYLHEKAKEQAKFYLQKHLDLGGQYQERASELLNSIKNEK